MPRRNVQPRSKGLLTIREIASEEGVQPGQVRRWIDDGCPVALKGGPGKSALLKRRDVIAWRRAKAARSAGAVSLEAERARKERAHAILAEQTYAIRSRDLLPAAEVERVWSTHVVTVKSKLLAGPPVLADRIMRAARLGTAVDVESILETWVHDTLRELANCPLPEDENAVETTKGQTR